MKYWSCPDSAIRLVSGLAMLRPLINSGLSFVICGRLDLFGLPLF